MSHNVTQLPYCALLLFHDVYLWPWAIQSSRNSQGCLLCPQRWTNASPGIYFITRSNTFQTIHDLKIYEKFEHKAWKPENAQMGSSIPASPKSMKFLQFVKLLLNTCYCRTPYLLDAKIIRNGFDIAIACRVFCLSETLFSKHPTLRCIIIFPVQFEILFQRIIDWSGLEGTLEII